MAEKNKPEVTEVTEPEEEMITIRLPRNKDEDAKFVSINDRSWLIKRGTDVKVPRCVAEVLRDSEEMEEVAFEYSQSKQHV